MNCLILKALLIIYFITNDVVSQSSCTVDPCDKPPFCSDGDITANIEDCGTFYYCIFNDWNLQSCPGGLSLDVNTCQCTYLTEALCAACNSSSPDSTAPPGVCPGVPDVCTEGQRYPDASDCGYFFECTGGELISQECDPPIHSCLFPAMACAFDIHSLECVNPDPSFNCDYRCLTTLPHSDITTAITTEKLTTENVEYTTTHIPGDSNTLLVVIITSLCWITVFSVSVATYCSCRYRQMTQSTKDETPLATTTPSAEVYDELQINADDAHSGYLDPKYQRQEPLAVTKLSEAIYEELETNLNDSHSNYLVGSPSYQDPKYQRPEQMAVTKLSAEVYQKLEMNRDHDYLTISTQ